jgi:hypothetical protein
MQTSYERPSRRVGDPPRAFTRMEPAAGERFEVDWAHFDSLLCQGDKLYAFCQAQRRMVM